MIYIATGISLISLITVVQVAVQTDFANLQGFLTSPPFPVDEKLEKTASRDRNLGS